MVGLPAQELLSLDQLVLLTQQGLILGERLSQPDFRAPVFRELVFVARNRAALQVFKCVRRRD
jgi:hypothetical protein